MNIRYITPFAVDKNIGREYNQVISELPEDCYVCLRDGDTMFMTHDWGKHIEEIILDNPQYDVITCMTNRIANTKQRVHTMFHEFDINKHHNEAVSRSKWLRTEVIPHTVAPGMFMLFHKSLWNDIKFVENSYHFDKRFSEAVLNSGRKIGLATGLYLLHLYRWGQKSPTTYVKHLV